MKKRMQILSITIIATLLAACNMPARQTATPIVDQALAGTLVAMTLEAIHTSQPSNTQPILTNPLIEFTVMNSPVPSATPSAETTATLTATITPTFSTPFLIFDGNTNCREGPGTNYRVVTLLRVGQKIEPVGVQGNYWVVNNPNGPGTCWVAADFATPSGSTWTITTVTAPPPPTGLAPTAPSWSKWHYECVFAQGGSTVTMSLLWTDLSTTETGYKVYRDGKVIATLAADANSYSDVAFVESGKSLEYYVEAYTDTQTADTSTISASCQ